MTCHHHVSAAIGGSATEALKDEHKIIMKVIAALRVLLERGESDGSYDFTTFEECIRFFRLFADKCHHGKEEDVLFEELIERGFPREQGPIAVMIAEHRMGRGFVAEMSAALPGANSGDEHQLTRLLDAAYNYCDLLEQHIGKEDHCLFSMAEGAIDEPACRRICERYAGVCTRKFENHSHEDLVALATSIEQKYTLSQS